MLHFFCAQLLVFKKEKLLLLSVQVSLFTFVSLFKICILLVLLLTYKEKSRFFCK